MGGSFREKMDAVKKNQGMIYCLILFSVIASITVTVFFTTPIYQSSAQLLVNQPHEEDYRLNKYDMQDDIKSIVTYSDIIKSRVVLEKVKDRLELDLSIRELNENIAVDHARQSQAFEITVKNPDPEKAVLIANAAAEVFQQEAKERMNASNVTLLAPALMADNPQPVEPDPLTSGAIAALLALCAGTCIALILPNIDNTIKNSEDAESVLETPVIGMISKIPGSGAANVIRFPEDRKKA